MDVFNKLLLEKRSAILVLKQAGAAQGHPGTHGIEILRPPPLTLRILRLCYLKSIKKLLPSEQL